MHLIANRPLILIRSDQICTVETSSTGRTNDVGSNKVLTIKTKLLNLILGSKSLKSHSASTAV